MGKPIDYHELDSGHHAFERHRAIFDSQLRVRRAKWPARAADQDRRKRLRAAVVRPLILVDGSSLNNVPSTWGPESRFSIWRLPLGMAHRLYSVLAYGLRSEYYHPFTPLTHWFVAPRAVGTAIRSISTTTTTGFHLPPGLSAAASMLAISLEPPASCESATKAAGKISAPNRKSATSCLPFPAPMGMPRFSIRLDRLDDPVIPRRARPRKPLPVDKREPLATESVSRAARRFQDSSG